MTQSNRLGVLTPSSNTGLEPLTSALAAPLAEFVEAELGIPLLDSVSTTVWGQLCAVGAVAAQVRGWGQLFGWR